MGFKRNEYGLISLQPKPKGDIILQQIQKDLYDKGIRYKRAKIIPPEMIPELLIPNRYSTKRRRKEQREISQKQMVDSTIMGREKFTEIKRPNIDEKNGVWRSFEYIWIKSPFSRANWKYHYWQEYFMDLHWCDIQNSDKQWVRIHEDLANISKLILVEEVMFFDYKSKNKYTACIYQVREIDRAVEFLFSLNDIAIRTLKHYDGYIPESLIGKDYIAKPKIKVLAVRTDSTLYAYKGPLWKYLDQLDFEIRPNADGGYDHQSNFVIFRKEQFFNA